MTPRDLALKTLNRERDRAGFPERFPETAFKQAPRLSELDRAFVFHLVQGVLRWRLRLDWTIEQALRFPFHKVEPAVLNILRLGLYQILFMDRVPASAAVNEAVKQAKALGRPHLARFVNGILRGICRRNGQAGLPDPRKDRARYLSVACSYPLWMVQKWIREMGAETAGSLLAAGNQTPRMVVRTNSVRIRRGELIRRLREEGVEAGECGYSPDGVVLENLRGPIDRLEAFRRGWLQVQDEAAQICAYLLDPRPGRTILDICAGLGGKSTHMAQLMRNSGRVLALDRHVGRLLKLAESAQRLGSAGITPLAADATADLSALLRCRFDGMLVDGPCSGLGVIARHPDIKWRRDEGRIRELPRLQRRILESAAPLLKKGGCLLYVTCTLSKEENEEVVAGLLAANRDLRLADLRKRVPPWGRELINAEGFFKSLPHLHGMDGFFGALLEKKGNRSQVQGSTFRVKDKNGIKGPGFR